MPIYDFECPSCGKIREVFTSFSDKDPQICEDDGSEMKKIITKALAIRKGAGLYSIDSDYNDMGSYPVDDD